MPSDSQGQDKIWRHFQNEGTASFSGNRGRLEYLARRLAKGCRVLNVGVGNGLFEDIAKQKGMEVWSLDPDDQAILRLRNTLALGDRARSGYSTAIPFASAFFDAVVMSEVLEHLDDDQLHRTLKEVRRVLKPKGTFLGTVPARENLENAQVVCPGCGLLFHRWGHQQSFDLARMQSIMGENFAVQQLHEIFFIEWDSVDIWAKFQGIVKKLLSWKGIGTYGTRRNIFFMARK